MKEDWDMLMDRIEWQESIETAVNSLHYRISVLEEIISRHMDDRKVIYKILDNTDKELNQLTNKTEHLHQEQHLKFPKKKYKEYI